MEDTEEDSFYYYNQYKQRNVSKRKYPTGHSYRKLSTKDWVNYNCESLVYVVNDLPKNESKLINGLNLLITDEEQVDTEDRMIKNKSANFRGEYSLSKKNRWVLPEILQDKSKNELKFEKPSKDESKDGHSDKFSYSLICHFHEKSCKRRNMSKTYKYFNNNDFHLEKIVPTIFLNTSFFTTRPMRQTKRLAKKRTKRLQFKNGNRNRNSGIKRSNEVFILEEEVPEENAFLNAREIRFDFFMPQKMLETRKSIRSSLKSCLGRTKDFGSKFIRNNYRMNDADKRALLQTEKHKKCNVIRDSIHYALTKDNAVDIIMDPYKISNTYYDEPTDKSIKVNLSEIIGKKSKSIDRLLQYDNNLAHVFIPDFKGNKIFEPKQETEEDNEEQTNEPEQKDSNKFNISTGLFEQFNFTVTKKDEFIRSIIDFYSSNNDTVTLIRDSSPNKLLVNITENLLLKLGNNQYQDQYDVTSYLIFNIDNTICERFYLNTLIGNQESVRLNSFIEDNGALNGFKDDDVYSLINSFCDILCHFIVYNQNTAYLVKKETSKSDIVKKNDSNSLLGCISFINEDSLLKGYEKYLNKETTVNWSIKLETDIIKNFETKLKTCDICYDELEYPSNFFTLNECGHEACINCWQTFILTKIKNMKVTYSLNKEDSNTKNVRQLCCLEEKCNKLLRIDVIMTLIPVDFVKKYIKFYTELKVAKSRDTFVYCKNTKCDKLIVIENPDDIELNVSVNQDMIYVCECGYKICRFCLGEMHFPALCKQAKTYIKGLNKLKEIRISDTSELYTSEGKNCPNCDNYMEKNMGCNHMSCICGFQFCWLCLKDFYTYHNSSDGYFCKFKPAELKTYDHKNFLSFKWKTSFVKLELNQIMQNQRLEINSKNLSKLEKGFDKLILHVYKYIHKSTYSVFRERHKEPNDVNAILDLIGLKASSLSQSKFIEFNEEIMKMLKAKMEEVKSNYLDLNRTIEYLALLLTSPVTVFKINKYSFKPNLYKSLKKSLFLKQSIYDIIIYGSKSDVCTAVDLFKKILFYNQSLVKFINNLKYLTNSYLKIYDKNHVNQSIDEDDDTESDNDDDSSNYSDR